MTHEKDGNGFGVFQKMGWVTGAILGSSGVIILILTLWGQTLFATKEFEADVKKNYATKEIIALELSPMKIQLAEIKEQQKEMLKVLMRIDRK